MTFSDAPRRRPPLRVRRWPKNTPLRYKNNKKSEHFFCKLPNLDGQTTRTLTFQIHLDADPPSVSEGDPKIPPSVTKITKNRNNFFANCLTSTARRPKQFQKNLKLHSSLIFGPLPESSVTAAETDDPQVLPLPKVQHNANLHSHPLTPNTTHPLSKRLSHPPLHQPSQQTPQPLHLSTEKNLQTPKNQSNHFQNELLFKKKL